MLTLRHRIALSHFSLVALCAGGLGWGGWWGSLQSQRREALQRISEEARALSAVYPKLAHRDLLHLSLQMHERIRVFGPDGNCRFDTASLSGGFVGGQLTSAAGRSPRLESVQSDDFSARLQWLPPEARSPQEAETIPVAVAASPLPEGETLYLSRSLLDLQEKSLAEGQFLLQLTLGLSLVAAGLSYLLARLTLGPLRHLASGATRLAQGRLETRVPVPSRDELSQVAQAFNAMAAQLEQREELMRQFSADASHELKTPLASMRALLAALQDGALQEPEQAARFVSLLDSEMQRLQSLVEELRDLHRLESPGALQLEDTNLQALLAETVEQFPDVVLSAVPAWARCDGRRIRQVVINLLENCRAHQGTAAHLDLRPEGEGWRLTVSDSGPGVPADKLPLLFERFYRVEDDRGRRAGGSGLGLAICKRIVEGHGGQIYAEAGPQGGLQVTLVLPQRGHT